MGFASTEARWQGQLDATIPQIFEAAHQVDQPTNYRTKRKQMIRKQRTKHIIY